MNNKVVTTLARVFKDLGIPSLRFNFRGVGQSEDLMMLDKVKVRICLL